MTPLYGAYIFCVIIGWIIGASKGRGFEGLFISVLLGPLGIIIAAIMKPTVAIQAQRDVALETERERIRAEVRAEMEAERRAGQPYNTEIGRPPGAE